MHDKWILVFYIGLMTLQIVGYHEAFLTLCIITFLVFVCDVTGSDTATAHSPGCRYVSCPRRRLSYSVHKIWLVIFSIYLQFIL